MKTGEPKRMPLGVIIVLAIVLVWISLDVRAGDDRVDVDTVVKNENVLTGGDNTAENNALVGGSRAYSIAAPGLSDVDISQCLGSTSWTFLIGGKQKLVLNHVCMAEFYLKTGQYGLAAQSLCNQKEILAEYETEKACEEAHDFGPMPIPASATPEPTKDDEDYHAQHEFDFNAIQARLSDLEAQRQAEAERAEKAAYRANVAAENARKIEVERKEYAQKVYEELAEWK